MHRLPGAGHQEIEGDLGMRRNEPARFRRQREGQQKVVGRDEALHLTFQPLPALVVLAVRAKAMAAGMRNEFLLIAAFALELHHRAGRSAAIAHRGERPKLIEA